MTTNKLDSLLEMSNAEAADIIENMLDHAMWPRGNAKPMILFQRAAALLRAIDVLRGERK